jgi:hypothetical protein
MQNSVEKAVDTGRHKIIADLAQRTGGVLVGQQLAEGFAVPALLVDGQPGQLRATGIQPAEPGS